MKNILIVGLTLWAIITLYISLPGFRVPYWITNFSLPHLRTVGQHFIFLMQFLSIVLIFRGLILRLMNRDMVGLKPFQFSMQLIVAQNIFLLMATIFGSNNSLWLLNEEFEWGVKLYYYMSFILLWPIAIYSFKNTSNNSFLNESERVSKKSRLVNFIIDKSLIVALTFGHLRITGNGFILDDFEFFRKNITWWISLNGFLYYLVLEILFRQTIGKLHNNSYVQSSNGSISSIVIRSLCRMIPFDVFSFLGSTGWHDSLSKTSVVKGGNGNAKDS
jgi:hypothetical protein